MPKRTNLFQEVVATVHRHLAGDAEVEESAMLLHRQTETLREVDVVIRSTVAGQEVVVSVEATSGGRRASVERVERMLKKHAELPTNKLVLVAQGGFASTARLLAEKNGAVPIAPEDMTGGEPAYGIVNNLNHVRARIFSLRVVELQLVVSDRQGAAPSRYLIPLRTWTSGRRTGSSCARWRT